MKYKNFEGYVLNDQKKRWRYECVSDIPMKVFIRCNREESCSCGNDLALLTFKFQTNEIESKKMHGRKCPVCGCNYFTDKTVNLCPDAFIVGTFNEKKENNIEYLFVDLEWNQKEGTRDIQNREPIQIGIIGTDNHFESVKPFSKYIRLEDVTALRVETSKMTHVNENSLMKANTLEGVFNRVRMSFPTFKYIVVWTMSTYELFVQSAEKTGIKIPRHKVIVLQDIVSMIAMSKGNNIGFETALIKAEITYDPSYLHYSKHDVQYMYELFKKLYSEYLKLTKEESCVINENSKIIHSPDCRYVNRSAADIGKKNLIFKGYRPCNCCGTEENWRRIFWEPVSKKTRTTSKKKNDEELYRNLALTDENIERICNRFNIKCHIGERIVFLTTNCGCWRVYLVGEEVDEVFHGNYRVSKSEFKKKKKWNEGYHKQNISQVKFYDAVRYIYYHDKYSYSSRKKSRVDILLEQIEQERLIKEEAASIQLQQKTFYEFKHRR